MLKLFATVLVLVPLMAAKGTLSSDGQKYLAAAKTRIAKVEKTIAPSASDPEKARAAADDLLASKRFLDNVQQEAPKHGEAASLQKKADVLLAKLEPVLLKDAIGQRLSDVDEVIASIEKDLASPRRSAEKDDALRNRFDMLRDMVKQVLANEPKNERALAAANKENELWQKFREQQRRASGNGGGK